MRMMRPRLLPTSPSISSTSGSSPAASAAALRRCRGDRMQAGVGGIAAPGKRQRDRALTFLEVGAGERAARRRRRPRERSPVQGEIARQHRQILQRQLVGIGDQDGVAADLDRELRGADHGRADAGPGPTEEVAPVRQAWRNSSARSSRDRRSVASPACRDIPRRRRKRSWRRCPCWRARRASLGHQQRAGKLAQGRRSMSPMISVPCARRSAVDPKAQALCRRELDAERASTASAGGSMRVEASSSSTIRRPPTAMAQVARMRPLSISELGGAAADIDVEQRRVVAARERDGARAVRRHLAFHVMSGRGTDELAGFLRKQVGDGAGVAALERLAGQDDGAAVDRLALDAGIGVAAADEAGELVDVDGVVGLDRASAGSAIARGFSARPRRNGSTAPPSRCRCTRRTSDATWTSRCRCRPWSARHCRRPRRPH